MDTNRPIGVIDSGVGGLSVLRALQQTMPHETFLYLGDTARAPYGTRSRSGGHGPGSLRHPQPGNHHRLCGADDGLAGAKRNQTAGGGLQYDHGAGHRRDPGRPYLSRHRHVQRRGPGAAGHKKQTHRTDGHGLYRRHRSAPERNSGSGPRRRSLRGGLYEICAADRRQPVWQPGAERSHPGICGSAAGQTGVIWKKPSDRE